MDWNLEGVNALHRQMPLSDALKIGGAVNESRERCPFPSVSIAIKAIKMKSRVIIARWMKWESVIYGRDSLKGIQVSTVSDMHAHGRNIHAFSAMTCTHTYGLYLVMALQKSAWIKISEYWSGLHYDLHIGCIHETDAFGNSDTINWGL